MYNEFAILIEKRRKMTMKKIISIFAIFVMMISLVACGESAPKTYEIGEAVSSNNMELCVKSVTFNPNYPNDDSVRGSIQFKNDPGYTFLVVRYTIKNIGKTDLGFVTTPVTRTILSSSLISLDYNNGYEFNFGDAIDATGQSFHDSCFKRIISGDDNISSEHITDLKPLGKTIEIEIGFYVPSEVETNTSAPLNINAYLYEEGADKDTVSVTYKVR